MILSGSDMALQTQQARSASRGVAGSFFSYRTHACRVVLMLILLITALPRRAPASEYYLRQDGWVDTLLQARTALTVAALPDRDRADAADRIWYQMQEDFPVQWDWLLQDAGQDFSRWFATADGSGREQELARKAVSELGDSGRALARELDQVAQRPAASPPGRLLALYGQACELRRQQRLQTVLATTPRIVFTKHRTIRPSFFAYTEGQSDAQDERHFVPGAELCLLEMSGLYGRVRTLVSDPTGAIRDPAVSLDGSRVVFAWKKSLNDDDYHLYELNVAENKLRQITSGAGFADYEPAFLPNGDLIFASTRCVQTVDCWWTEVSNLYTCDQEGRYLRRLGFDQVHTVYPQVLDDGRVVYTRWDYNDRGQVFPQPLFQMNPDGTGQTEFYGNNSWFPTTIAHARGIPGTGKVMAILCGHHSSQAGKLAVIDPSRGRQENSGVQLIAPVRETPAERIDSYGQAGALWEYPFPLNETECLVTFAPLGWDRPQRRRGDADFGIYWMSADGRRELIAWDKRYPCSQPVPLAGRPSQTPQVNRLDYSKSTGTYHLQDVYAGPGLARVPRGTIKKLRVVALDFRPAGIGHNSSGGPGGGALISTPIAIGNGAWDVKTILGEARVYEDGSALFSVPAQTPVYFQALDEKGRAVQTMRSWSTLQPGEYFGCVGCHDHKNAAPPTEAPLLSLAMKAGPQALEPFYGPARGFSFPKEIQPILDRHCVRCHNDRGPLDELALGKNRMPPLKRTAPSRAPGNGTSDETAFSLLGAATTDHAAKRNWSDAYLILTSSLPDQTENGAMAFRGDSEGRIVNWISSQSVPTPLPPYSGGSTRSELLPLLEKGHGGVKLTREELEKIACWIDLVVPYCGDFREANAWTAEEMRKFERYSEKRLRMQEIEKANLREFLAEIQLK
jgi:hypothetical protein